MPKYRFLFFRDQGNATTMDNPLAPMPSGEFDHIMDARTAAHSTGETMPDARFLVIEDDRGNVIERWHRDAGGWRRDDA